MTRLISAELLKLRKRTMTWVLLAVLAGILVLLYFLLLAISKVQMPPNAPAELHGTLQNLLGLPLAIPFALSMISSFGSVLAVILIASSMGNEYNWRTIRTVLICSEGRLRLLGAKLISALLLVLAGMVIGVAVGFLMSLLTTALGGYAFDFSFITGSYLWEQFLQFWRTLFVILPYFLLGFLFAIVGRAAMPGIALGIGVYFLESIVTVFMELAGGWIAEIPDYLPAANVRAINAMANLPSQVSAGMGGATTALPSPGHAFVVLGIYCLVFLVVALYLFRRRDVTG